jgi:hypothetical protein
VGKGTYRGRTWDDLPKYVSVTEDEHNKFTTAGDRWNVVTSWTENSSSRNRFDSCFCFGTLRRHSEKFCSISSSGKTIFLFLKAYRLELGPPSFISKRYRWLFLRYPVAGVWIWPSSRLRSRMRRDIPQLSEWLLATCLLKHRDNFILLRRYSSNRDQAALMLRFTHTHTHTHTDTCQVILLWKSDQVATYTKKNKHKNRTYVPFAEFEHANPAIERLQTYALDRRATGTGVAAPLHLHLPGTRKEPSY